MTDAEFIFNQDVREKSITKRSVSKTNRTGKGAVRFPSDNLSRKERNALNGPVETLNLNHIYTWDEFKCLNDDMKVRLINHLINKFGVALGTINTYYFDMSDSAGILHGYLRYHKLLEYINVGKKGGKISQNKIQAFITFINQNKNKSNTNPEPVAKTEDCSNKEVPICNEIQEASKDIKNPISEMQFTMTSFSMGALVRILDQFDLKNISLEIKITVKEG